MPDISRDLDICRRHLCNGSRTFHLASFALPGAVREAAIALYAFCRVADDDVDIRGGRQALSLLEARLERIYTGQALTSAIDRAFAAVVARYEMPRALPAALLEGLRWDIEGRRYETLADVHAYAARVAGSVGAMMAVVMGVRSAELLARAIDLGIAMQLSNIARDVGEDARNGRLYLPRVWLREAGIDADAWLRAPVHCAALGEVVARLLASAEALYACADEGIAGLPRDCRFAITAARRIYAAIGHTVQRRNCNAVDARAVVSTGRKLQLLMGSVLWSLRGVAPTNRPPLPGTNFLIEAAARHDVRPGGQARRVRRREWPHLQQDLIALIDLFERLERRQRDAHAARAHLQARN